MKHPYTIKVHILKNDEILKGETILCNEGDLLFTMDWQQNKIAKMSNGVDVFKTKNEIIKNEDNNKNRTS